MIKQVLKLELIELITTENYWGFLHIDVSTYLERWIDTTSAFYIFPTPLPQTFFFLNISKKWN